MKRSILKPAVLVFIVCLTFASGCGNKDPNTEKSILGKEQEWPEGHGELPNRIGNANPAGIGYPTDISDSDLWELSGFDPPTGRWFLHNGEGRMGYGLSTGTHQAGDEIYVEVIAHGDDGVVVDRDVRIQLSERTEQLDLKRVVTEEIIHLTTVSGHERIFTGHLPDSENTAYILSAEFLLPDGEVEDTRVSLIYVPKPEINASLSTDQPIYSHNDTEVTLILANDGPTTLMLGTYYTIEKKVNHTWRVVPLDRAFEDIGIVLSPGQSYDQVVDVKQLNKGEYRLVKEFRADGLELVARLAAPFSIE